MGLNLATILIFHPFDVHCRSLEYEVVVSGAFVVVVEKEFGLFRDINFCIKSDSLLTLDKNDCSRRRMNKERERVGTRKIINEQGIVKMGLLLGSTLGLSE